MLARFRIGQRFLLCFLMFSGLITNYMLRVNMSIAIVTMAQKANSSRSACVSDDATDDGDDGGGTTLDWSGDEVSWVLLSFFIGYAAFQVRDGNFTINGLNLFNLVRNTDCFLFSSLKHITSISKMLCSFTELLKIQLTTLLD